MNAGNIVERAIAKHQAGDLAGAERDYRSAIEKDPDNAECIHLLGVIQQQRGNHAASIDMIRRAIGIDERNAAFRSNLAVALRAAGRLEEAAAELREALRLDPRYTVARKNLGVILNSLGRSAEAEPLLRQAAAEAPGDPAGLKQHGVALMNLGRLPEAAETLRAAAERTPDDTAVLNNLGIVLKELGRIDEALAYFEKAAAVDPDSAETYNNLGTALSAAGRLEEALPRFRKALEIKPGYLEARHNLGVALRDLGNLREGVDLLRQAVEASPGDPEAQNNLAAGLQCQGQYDEAMVHYKRALRIKPDHVWAHFNRSTLLLGGGDYEHGWLEYEWRLKRPGTLVRRFDKPLWDGTPLPEGSVLLYTEQGLGDTIQFVRYAPLVKERVGTVILECQELLLPILSRCRGIDRLVPAGGERPPFDRYAPLMSLGGILDTRVDSIPAAVPYILPDPALVKRWKDRLDDYDGFLVGINWQGNPRFQRDYQRSMPLSHFAPLADVPGVRLISLQWGPGREQLPDAAQQFPVVDLGEDIDRDTGAFMDRAAIMMNLDLVVSSDTATPHLAGALGAPVWTALCYSPDWRWFTEGEANPWYPTMRLFRQPAPGNWEAVFRDIAAALREEVATAGGGKEPQKT